MPRRASDFDQEEERGDGVYYASANDRNRASFSAVSPPNSAHAARLARLSMAVHQPKGHERNENQRLIGDNDSHTRMIESGSVEEPPRQRQPHRSWFHSITGRRTVHKDDLPRYEASEPERVHRAERRGEREDYRITHLEPRETSVVVPPDAEVEVTRDRNEHRTSYNIQGSKGYVRVSAPMASNEAELFDAIADGRTVPRYQPGDSIKTRSRY
ncbi:unnamed protein product [Clonostachys rosea]|uniref:Uncharacterized protein n=1 Tax=Bionectria ochroleuca TaxID=29856 RepID=A0ABY6U204_BIOOC|nr:unnamed protein product [Clonostachys rosea]